MTDKQIIIDYENLCENYSKVVGCYNTFDGSCIKEQCFTYRLLQLLKAKEQECEELKEDEKSLLNVIDDLQKTKNEWQEKYNDLGQDFDQLKAENKQLKKQIESDKGLITSAGKQNYQLIQEYDRLESAKEQAEQKLERIREIAMTIMDDDVEENSCYWDARQILQIIDEVIPNEN